MPRRLGTRAQEELLSHNTIRKRACSCTPHQSLTPTELHSGLASLLEIAHTLVWSRMATPRMMTQLLRRTPLPMLQPAEMDTSGLAGGRQGGA
jgi:hypothetical protein